MWRGFSYRMVNTDGQYWMVKTLEADGQYRMVNTDGQYGRTSLLRRKVRKMMVTRHYLKEWVRTLLCYYKYEMEEMLLVGRRKW